MIDYYNICTENSLKNWRCIFCSFPISFFNSWLIMLIINFILKAKVYKNLLYFMRLNNSVPETSTNFYRSKIGPYVAIQVSKACLLGVCDFHCTANIMTARNGIYHYSKWNIQELIFFLLNSLKSPDSWIGIICVI